MPQLNRDLLREVLCELAKEYESYKNIDKFMMAGKEPFQLVIDMCKKADNAVICKDEIFAKLPHVKYPAARGFFSDGSVTRFPLKMMLFKPIFIALASSLTSLEVQISSFPCLKLRSCTQKLIPMLKSIDQVMNNVYIRDDDKQYRIILEACCNIPYVQNGVTINLCWQFNLIGAMKFFDIPCHELTIENVDLKICKKKMVFDNPHLRNIRHLTIKGSFKKGRKYVAAAKQFVAFLSTNFPNLETFNAHINVEYSKKEKMWNWNDNRMANLFKSLPSGVNGSITYDIYEPRFITVDPVEYPDVQRDDDVYFKTFTVTNDFSLKLVTTFNPDREGL